MNDLRFAPEALSDLDEIWEYIASDLSNSDAAQNTIDGILDSIEQLRQFAESGAPLNSVTDIISDYRFLIYGNYVVFYRHNNSEVFIDRILYGRRNYLRILFDEKN